MEAPKTILAASIGTPDTLLLMVLALVVFGPRRLPEIGRKIGKLIHEFRKISNDFKLQMEEELRTSEEAEAQKKLPAAASAPTKELDLAPQPAHIGKIGAAAQPEAISETEWEANHA
jgi:sec-independent protein translocase protein TatB